MNYLLFGASGLIGTHLLPILEETNTVHTVGRRNNSTINVDLESEWNADDLPDRIDSVIYLAQSEKFRDFPESAESVFCVNTLSLLRAFDYARRAGVRTFVYTSTGGVYGKSDEPFDEKCSLSPLGELGYYAATKMCGEIVAENYTPYMNVVVLRPFFVYGPGQRKDMLIPRLVERVRNGQSIQLAGEDGLHINPTYVEDAVRAIQQALSVNTSCKVNIGGPEVLSLRRIGEHIGEALGKEVRFEQTDGVPARIVGSIEKMSRLLWRPRVSFSQGIKMYIDSLL